MPRPLRVILPGITYHVCSRCRNKKPLLKDALAAELFEYSICRALDKYIFNLIAYQFMDNHFHLVIQTVEGEASISRIMQYIKARFAERYNKLHNCTGPFWNERFTDSIIEFSDDPKLYLLWLLWYLAFNPVRKNFTTDPRKYKYSSINYYLDESYKSNIKVVLHDYFIQLGTNFRERVNAFLEYEDAYRKRLALEF